MAQKIRCKLIRKVRRDRQERQDPVHGPYFPVALRSIFRAHTFPKPADRSYQLQVPTSAGTSAVRIASTEMLADFYFSNLSFFKIAIQIERSCMAIVAKQEEFCCGPRQGN
jgi:hypothetical protein